MPSLRRAQKPRKRHGRPPGRGNRKRHVVRCPQLSGLAELEHLGPSELARPRSRRWLSGWLRRRPQTSGKGGAQVRPHRPWKGWMPLRRTRISRRMLMRGVPGRMGWLALRPRGRSSPPGRRLLAKRFLVRGRVPGQGWETVYKQSLLRVPALPRGPPRPCHRCYRRCGSIVVAARFQWNSAARTSRNIAERCRGRWTLFPIHPRDTLCSVNRPGYA